MDDDDGLVQLEIQDRSKWDRDLMWRRFYFLKKTSMGNELSEYPLDLLAGRPAEARSTLKRP
jgi:predicted RNA polymerase sigma factor